ncbi:MAG TPA: flagellar hook-associated protein FlgL [Candidatus Elarobacter sp.]|jgi:flagellar hook-associated protein 3 FlgL
MRIATSTIYEQQTAAITSQAALYAQIGQQLSSGKQLGAPSDDPARIAQDLALHTAIDSTNQQSNNVQNAVSELTTTDSALSSLTSVLQSARQLAIQGSTETLTDQQRAALGDQIDQLLQQAIAVGNTSYGGRYVFAGTAKTANPPVQQQGNPISAVSFLGNQQTQGQLVYNGQEFALSTTFQAAFNYQSPDGSPDVFRTLINLRDTLVNKTAVDQSAAAINRAGAVVYGPQGAPGSPAPTTLAAANTFAVQPVADSSGNFSLTINGSVNGVQGISTITMPPATALDDGTATSLVGRINAVSATTGVTAAFNAKTQRVVLTGQGSFYVSDTPSPGATNSGNLSTVLNLAPQADFVQNVSTQLGDVDHALNAALSARSVVGARIQALGAIQSQLQTAVTDNTKVESGIEDVDVASAVSKFSQTQTALQAAYSTTTKLESKTLFDYLG